MRNLPNFLIVGAAKSGTSSLQYYLTQHPNIYMPTYDSHGKNIKEPMFLVKNNVKERVHRGIWTLEQYSTLFESVTEEKAIGEATVFYLNFYEEAIPNIKNILGLDTKIIIILRNPIDRAYSAYYHTKRNNIKENLSFEDALIMEENRYKNNKNITPMVLYKSMGNYYEMVKAYLNNFDNVKIIWFEDLETNPERVLRGIFSFLGVDENIEIDFTIKKNLGGWNWKSNSIKSLYLNKGPLKNICKKIFKASPLLEKIVKEKVFENNKEIIPPMKTETRKYLIEYFSKDIQSLATLTNKDLSHWLK
jgi:hypothetical protein